MIFLFFASPFRHMPHLAFDRGKKLARGESGARLTQKNTTRRVEIFLSGIYMALPAEEG